MSLGQSNSCHWVSLCHWAFLKCHQGNPHVIGTCSHVIRANPVSYSFPIPFSAVFRRNLNSPRTSFHFLVKIAQGSIGQRGNRLHAVGTAKAKLTGMLFEPAMATKGTDVIFKEKQQNVRRLFGAATVIQSAVRKRLAV